LDIDELEVIIEKALETLKLKREVIALRKQAMCNFKIENIIGQSEGMKNALKMANKIAASHDTTVLIEGETALARK
jgi:DNA-binding NtrC family response regulator